MKSVRFTIHYTSGNNFCLQCETIPSKKQALLEKIEGEEKPTNYNNCGIFISFVYQVFACYPTTEITLIHNIIIFTVKSFPTISRKKWIFNIILTFTTSGWKLCYNFFITVTKVKLPMILACGTNNSIGNND